MSSLPRLTGSTFKIMSILFLIFTLLTLILLFFTPIIVSTSWGKSKVVKLIDSRINGYVTVERLELTWFGKQKIEDLTLLDTDNQIILNVPHLEIENSLVHLIWNAFNPPVKLALTGLNGKISRSDDGISNLHKALNIQSNEAWTQLSPFIIEFHKIDGILDMSSSEGPLNVQLKGQVQSFGQEGVIDLHAAFDKGSLPQSLKILQINLNHFPVNLLAEVAAFTHPQWGHMLPSLIGPTIDLNLCHSKEAEGDNFDLHAKSSQVDINLKGVLEANRFRLTESGKINLALPSYLLANLVHSPTHNQIKSFTDIHLFLDILNLPFNPANNTFDISKTEIKAHAQMDPALLKLVSALASFDVNTLELQVEKLPHSPTYRTWLQALGHSDHPFPIMAIDLSLDPSTYQHDFSFNLPSLAFDQVSIPAKGQFKDLIVSFKGLSLNSSEIVLTTQMLPSKLTSGATLSEPIFLKLTGLLKKDANYNLNFEQIYAFIKTTLNSSHDSVPVEGKLTGNIAISNWIQNGNLNLEGSELTVQTDLAGFPTEVISRFSEIEGLPLLIGKSINMNLTYTNKEASSQKNVINFRLEGEGVQLHTPLKIGKEISFISRNDQPKLAYTLTPARFSLLQSLLNPPSPTVDKITLLEDAQIAADITSIKIASTDLAAKPNLKILQGLIQASVKLDKFNAIDQRTHESLRIENIHAFIESQDIKNELKFDLEATQKDSAGNKNPLIFKADVKNLFTPEGSINYDSMAVHFETHAKKIPFGLLSKLLPMDQSFSHKIKALFGSSFDINAKSYIKNRNGVLNLNITGTHGSTSIDGRVDKGILTLAQPLIAEISITPELGKYVLQDIIPILGGMISAENRLYVAIEPAGFSFSLKNLDWHTLEIGQMTINIGKVFFSNQGQIGKVMSLLKVNSDETIPVWFTPIYLDMHNSKIHLQRFDMLAFNKYPLATWGTVDFLKDYIHLIIGLRGKSLENYVKIPLISNHYMLQLPYKGKIGSARLDKTKLAVQIAALVSAATGTPQGIGIGALIGLASGALTEGKPPAPTTNPLPWESATE